MSKREIKYTLLIVLIFGIYVAIEYGRPQPLDWSITLSKFHKTPFGAWMSNDMLMDFFDGNVTHSNLSAYEILDTLQAKNLFIPGLVYSPDDEDIMATLNWVAEGHNLFISADYTSTFFSDTLSLTIEDAMLDTLNMQSFLEYDSSFLFFVNPQINQEKFWLSRIHLNRYISSIDTSNTEILAVNNNDMPVFVRMGWGDGKVYFSTTPMAFSNYYLLKDDNYRMGNYFLSYLDNGGIHWTEFYHMGRMEPTTPMRFILKEEALKKAYYLTMVILIIFMLFRAKRTQRIIPVIEPLKNATKEFAQTLGNLYMHYQDHKNASEKKIAYFFEFIRTHYYLKTNELDDEFYERLSHKSGLERKSVDQLFKLIFHLQSKSNISREQLLELNTRIDEFYLL